ncbi:MAG: hypothetical protein GPI95_12380 [Microcystis aeruginosa LG13-11]|nr:hypothetical protein [Microcystis aeruginosa LG13-11]
MDNILRQFPYIHRITVNLSRPHPAACRGISSGVENGDVVGQKVEFFAAIKV